MMSDRRPIAAAVLTLAIAACGSNVDEAFDPTVLYDVYGRPFEPAVAQQIQAVVADTGSYLNDPVMVEGVLYDECGGGDCWMVMKADSVGIRIVPSDFSPPDTLQGRRAVVHGRLTRADTTSFRLHATGVMVEKTRS